MRQLRRALAVALILTGVVAGIAQADYQPDNYCTTVEVVAVLNAGYDVSATGAGRYARIRDLTTGQTVVATDFGLGATLYTWTGLTVQELQESNQYQVQVSHTSLTTGYSTSGCVFSPPLPQAVTIERFEVVRGAFEWEATEDGQGYWVLDTAGRRWTSWVAAQSPGNWGWFSYRVWPITKALPYGTYILMAQDIDGRSGEVARFDYKTGGRMER